MELIFIYNAKSGLKQSLFDMGHKLFSPKTYPCRLCALTFDTFSENHIWKTFRATNKAAMVFYHSDEFENHYPNAKYEYPIILNKSKNVLNVVLSAKELNKIENVHGLMTQLKRFTNTTP
ncbi:GTPase [Winogradskyella maritima]|uniref:GTPase n=1 Tax=Winogradskyella maritima TaxID=1517766 RepID=A0ABV8AE81_9FLAO|nr:GTPase [Winogradskyella maritima]